jgi:hypothetical protein
MDRRVEGAQDGARARARCRIVMRCYTKTCRAVSFVNCTELQDRVRAEARGTRVVGSRQGRTGSNRHVAVCVRVCVVLGAKERSKKWSGAGQELVVGCMLDVMDTQQRRAKRWKGWMHLACGAPSLQKLLGGVLLTSPSSTRQQLTTGMAQRKNGADLALG